MGEFSLQPPEAEPDRERWVEEHLWDAASFYSVGIDLPDKFVGVRVDSGMVPRFQDPFTTYKIRHAGGIARVTVYESNYDGALCRGDVDAELRDALADRYGIHRWSEPSWWASNCS